MTMKLAVNAYLLGLMFGLFEGFAVARKGDLDMDQFARILEAGPMANPLMKMKLPKLLAREFDDVQGALSDGMQVVERIRQAGVDLDVSLPLMEAVQRMMNVCLLYTSDAADD